MNLRDLEYLVALENHRHFGQAAKACFVSQPTLSGQLKKLRDELGVDLLESTPRKVLFTEAGMAIVKQAQRTLFEAKEIETIAQNFRDPFSGKVKIASIPTVGPFLFPLVIQAWKIKFPKLSFELLELKTDEILSALKRGEIDLGILALPLHESSLKEEVIYQEQFVLMSHSSRQVGKGKINLEWFKKQELMLLSEGHCFKDQALQVCSQYDTNHRSDFFGTSLLTLKSMVEMDEGVTLVPHLAYREWSNQATHSEICFHHFPSPAPVRDVGLIYREGSIRIGLFEQLKSISLNMVTQAMGKAPRLKNAISLK